MTRKRRKKRGQPQRGQTRALFEEVREEENREVKGSLKSREKTRVRRRERTGKKEKEVREDQKRRARERERLKKGEE